MNGYLNSIVARALNPEPQVKPAVPSLFETRAVPEFDEEPLPAPPPKMQRDKFEFVQPVKPRNVERETAPELDRARPERIIERQTVRIETAPAQPTPALPQEPLPREAVNHIAVIERHTRESRETELRELVVEKISPSGLPSKAQSVPGNAAPSSTAPRSAVPSIISPAIRPVSVERTEVPAIEQSTVHVTIGRVEVTAVFPASAPPQPPKPKASPVMPLDEYLKQGNRQRR